MLTYFVYAPLITVPLLALNPDLLSVIGSSKRSTLCPGKNTRQTEGDCQGQKTCLVVVKSNLMQVFTKRLFFYIHATRFGFNESFLGQLKQGVTELLGLQTGFFFYFGDGDSLFRPFDGIKYRFKNRRLF